MKPLLTENFEAEAAIAKYRICKYGTGGEQAAQAAASTDLMFGISDSLGAAAAGDRVDVHTAGIVDVEYGGAVSKGDPLTADAQGRAVAATRHTHTENTAAAYTQNATTAAAADVRIVGHARVDGVLGDIGKCQISPSHA